MFLSRVLGDAAKHGQSQGPLDVLMPIDGGRDTGHDPLGDARVLGERGDGAHVLVGKGARQGGIVLLQLRQRRGDRGEQDRR